VPGCGVACASSDQVRQISFCTESAGHHPQQVGTPPPTPARAAASPTDGIDDINLPSLPSRRDHATSPRLRNDAATCQPDTGR
jgi:hypothetical protein